MMKSARICLVSLGCVAGALGFGVVANAAIDLVIPGTKTAVAVPVKAADEAPAPAKFELASAVSVPVDTGPAKVKTIPILMREGLFAEAGDAAPATTGSIPLPRRRPATAPTADMASLARQPGSLAIAAATRKASPEDGELLSPAGIDRMKSALALTAEQEEFWPAIASELRAIGKMLPKQSKAQTAPVHVDKEAM